MSTSLIQTSSLAMFQQLQNISSWFHYTTLSPGRSKLSEKKKKAY